MANRPTGSQDRQQGVQFPTGADGTRSTAATGRAVWADAVRVVDEGLAQRIEHSRNWRKDYVGLVVEHTAAATAGDKGAVEVARSGLDSLAGRMRFERDGAATPLAEALGAPREPLGAQVVRGEGQRETELVLPYRGQQLRGDALRRQVDAWVAAGLVEASCGQALHRVVDEPGWLDLSDSAFALLGAGAEMGPLEPLSRWGAHVVAVDMPVPAIWDRVTAAARAGAGTLTAVEGAPGTLGVDLMTRTPEVAAFLRTAAPDLPLTIGSYAYADGARHVQVVHASDAVVELLLRERPGTGYAELATPTDAFAVPAEVVDGARRNWAARGLWGTVQTPARYAGLYAPAYTTTVEREDGSTAGVADVLVPQQGPNYTLAKRVQRWRAVVAQADGHPVSANVAPATQTRSVTKNRLLAAAYAGAHRFGVEVFAPRTSRVLMAALLVHDVRAQAPAPTHPDDLFVSGAAHGGLWRVAYSPRSVLGLAAVLGLPRVLRPGR
ncbi:MAG TPA: hypothetical protein VFR07_16870 [Mycobacteriales bacterium]|nr:hypothetical protein [Mycobacteriales bacterium]